MLFRILDKEMFGPLIEGMRRNYEIIAPRRVATGREGRPIHHYLPVKNPGEIALDYDTTEFSAKTYFLPYRENLSRYRFDGADWEQEIDYYVRPRAFIGLHACDINALLKLDKVLLRDAFPSPYYLSRRKNTFIVGIDHEPCKGGFCKSVDADTVSEGFDLFLTDLGKRYFVMIGSDRGYRVLQSVPTSEVTEWDSHAWLETRRKISDSFTTEVDIHALPTVLDLEFDSPDWDFWGDKCLSCGSCAMVCPTCYCYGISEEVSMDLTQGAKVKKLHSCNLLDFAMVAGGHNFRPDPKTRLKYRYYHQHRGFVEAYDEPKCVGCNRCGRTCLAGINPPDVINSLLEEEEE